MPKNNGMILSVLNNFFGYPFDYTKYFSVNMRERDAKIILKNLDLADCKLSVYQIEQIKEMYKILEKEIEDWE